MTCYRIESLVGMSLGQTNFSCDRTVEIHGGGADG